MDIKTENLSLDIIVKRIKDSSLNPQPDFQRGYVWRGSMLSELILSILEKYPIGNVILNQTVNNDAGIDSEFVWDTIDGQQRLTTIIHFIENKFPLSKDISNKLYNIFRNDFELMLEKMDVKIVKNFTKIIQKLNNTTCSLTYDELPPKLQNRILSYPIQVTYILDANTNEIREYFRRVQNQEKLKAGEIINSLPDSIVTKIIQRLNDNEELIFHKLGYKADRNDLLKVLSNIVGIFEGKLHLGISDKYILKYIEDTKNISPITEEKIKRLEEFFLLLSTIDIKLKYNKTGIKLLLLFVPEYFNELNVSFGFEKTIVMLERIINNLRIFKSKDTLIKDEFLDSYSAEIVSKYESVNKITMGIHNNADVKESLNNLYQIIIHEIQEEEKFSLTLNKRNISEQQKAVFLKRSNYKCNSCSSTVTMKTSEIDHIIPYSKGGETIVDNLQVLCHDCNQEKKARLF